MEWDEYNTIADKAGAVRLGHRPFPSLSLSWVSSCACATASNLLFMGRMAVMWLVAVVYRFKYYFAWAISEAALIFSGFCFNGCNEKGEPRWDRYSNTRIRQVTIYHSPPSLSQTLRRTFDAVLHLIAPVWQPSYATRSCTSLPKHELSKHERTHMYRGSCCCTSAQSEASWGQYSPIKDRKA